MKEDILEQLVDEYLQHKGYFTTHNVKFRPRHDHTEYESKQDGVHSDIDVLAFHPLLTGPEKVLVVNCKSWQSGLYPARQIKEVYNDYPDSKRRAEWRKFRELVKPKWSEAFMDKVHAITGTYEFTHITAVTKLNGDKSVWENHEPFRQALRNNPIKLLTLNEILEELFLPMGNTPASSTIGRFIQLVKASGWEHTVKK